VQDPSEFYLRVITPRLRRARLDRRAAGSGGAAEDDAIPPGPWEGAGAELEGQLRARRLAAEGDARGHRPPHRAPGVAGQASPLQEEGTHSWETLEVPPVTREAPLYAYCPAAGGVPQKEDSGNEEGLSDSPVEDPGHGPEEPDAWEAALSLPRPSEWERALAPPRRRTHKGSPTPARVGERDLPGNPGEVRPMGGRGGRGRGPACNLRR